MYMCRLLRRTCILRYQLKVWSNTLFCQHTLYSPVVLLILLHSHNYDLVFGVSMLTLDKAQRLLYGDSLMTHAMVLTGFSWEVSKE